VANLEEAMKAIEEFEQITGQNIDDEGCGCCGPPHELSYIDGDTYKYLDSRPTSYTRNWS
jgi:hypothetical protein